MDFLAPNLMLFLLRFSFTQTLLDILQKLLSILKKFHVQELFPHFCAQG